MTMDKNAKRIRLAMYGADEDMPRLAMGYGRVRAGLAGAGEWAAAFAPAAGRAIVVHMPPRSANALVWQKTNGSDSPRKPALEVPRAGALAEFRKVKSERRAGGPAVLRGKWTGALYICSTHGTPTVQIERRITSYGRLVLLSDERGWAWAFHRDAKWFGKESVVDGHTAGAMHEAMREGQLAAMNLIREACGYKDTTRRGAVDPEHAKKHPPRRAPDPKRDPSERLDRQPRAARRPRTSAPKGPGAKRRTGKAMSAAERSAFKERMAAARAAKTKAKRGATAPAPRAARAKKAGTRERAKRGEKRKRAGAHDAAADARIAKVFADAMHEVVNSA